MDEKIESAIRENLEYDKETGKIYWTNTKGGRQRGKEAGSIEKNGYIRIKTAGKSVFAHRVAWFFCYGVWPEKETDHIDGNPVNNKIENLRSVSCRENQCNRRRHRFGGLVGASFDKRHIRNPWQARIKHGDKKLHIGAFATEQEAHDAYIRALDALLAEKEEK